MQSLTEIAKEFDRETGFRDLYIEEDNLVNLLLVLENNSDRIYWPKLETVTLGCNKRGTSLFVFLPQSSILAVKLKVILNFLTPNVSS